MDAVSVFGFMSAFVTCVLVGYRRQLRTRLPVIPVSIACCAAYGFLAGSWPLGFVLSLMVILELRAWLDHTPLPVTTQLAQRPTPVRRTVNFESRMNRMFGPA